MGCKANLTDSHALEAELRGLGGQPAAEKTEPDLFLLNTCTVTDQADREAGRILRRSCAGLNIATGCFAEVDPERLRQAGSGKSPLRILRNRAKREIGSLVQEWLAGALGEQREIWNGDAGAWHKSILPSRTASASLEPSAEHRTRAFFKVQDGCNAFCSYCVIPLARGRSRSLPVGEVVAEVRALVGAGIKEVVLTAIHAADYECDGLDFTGLVESVLRETRVPRLRLTSLDPAEIPDRLLSLMRSDSRLCPHFHVSLQSANSRVLAAMKRGYGAEAVEDRLQAIARELPHAHVGMDLIAGFPGETSEEFADAFERLDRLPWTRAHVFPFSSRRNTAAARLVEAGHAVPGSVVADRAAQLRALSDAKLARALSGRVGSVMEVLVEGKESRWENREVSTGLSRSYFKVAIPGRHPANELRRVRIIGTIGLECLKGELV
jgi:threonylcarbamoyladenosine tRNA methylthiotransferase MtaB